MDIQLADALETPASAAWLEGCKRHELLHGQCGACHKAHFYPRGHCPYCHSADVSLRISAGRGRVYSWTTVQAKPAPYVLAYVRLDEGFTMLTQLGGAMPPDGWAVSARVFASWATAPNDFTLPVFRLDTETSQGRTP